MSATGMRCISDFAAGPSADGSGVDGSDAGRPRACRAEPVIIVAGTSGGSGTSTSAALFARLLAGTRDGRDPRGARDGEGTALLAAADPSSIGLDMILGLEQEDGLRWGDIRAPLGMVDAQVLAARLPQADGVRVLAGTAAGDCADGPAGLLRPWERDAVLDALLGHAGPLVLDAGNGPSLPPGLAAALRRRCGAGSDTAARARPIVALLVPPVLPAVAIARTLIASIASELPCARCYGIVSCIGPFSSRFLSSSRLDEAETADFLGIPFIGRYRRSIPLARQIAEGLGLLRLPVSVERTTQRLLGALMDPRASSDPGRHVPAHGPRRSDRRERRMDDARTDIDR